MSAALKTRIRYLPAITFMFLGVAVSAPLPAAILTYGLDFEFSGGTPPAGSTPWITATFDDSFGGPNTVRLTMSANNLVGTEFVDEWSFNFDPALNPTLLSFAYVSGQQANAVSTGANAFKADGDGFFDILFDFPPPKGSDPKFTAGKTSVWDLTYAAAPITASSFNFGSVGGDKGSFSTAAHIQSIGADGEGSGWIGPNNGETIPEPGTFVVWSLLGAIGIAFFRHRGLQTQ